MVVGLMFSLGVIGLGSMGIVDSGTLTGFVAAIDFQEIVLHVMLAFLLFAGGLTVSIGDLRAHGIPVAIMSSVGVLVGACITGGLFWGGLTLIGIEIPFLVALVFGAIAAPTDAVAVLGILRKVGAPKSLEMQLVGESLFNDGIGVVVFLSIVSIAFGAGTSPSHVAVLLVAEVFGGAVLGIALGLAAYHFIRTVDGYAVEVLVTLALATGGYSLAEVLHVSAPICVVVSGLLIGNRGRMFAMSEHTREHLDSFWELLDELLNVVLFVLVGLEIVTLSLSGQYIAAGLCAVLAMVVSRLVTVGSIVSLLRPFAEFSPHAVKILTWGGLRGGISIALALSLPEVESRELLIVCTYCAVLFSVLVQGSTLPRLLQRTTARS
jgi:CPA1 family monovalent cation:H+ antiporter